MLVVGGFPPELQSERPPEHFVQQDLFECHLPNGTGPGVYFLHRYIWGRQELAQYDSRRGTYQARAPLGEADAAFWNSQKDLLEQRRAQVDSVCRHNYQDLQPFAAARKVKPQVQITPTAADPSSQYNLLVCAVDSFFPAQIKVMWLRNGQEEAESRVVSTEVIRNGDWTFSIQVMLEAQPKRGDVFTCQVEHASLLGPISVQWEPQSASARNKMWTGVVGILLGLVFLVPGVALYLKSQRALIN